MENNEQEFNNNEEDENDENNENDENDENEKDEKDEEDEKINNNEEEKKKSKNTLSSFSKKNKKIFFIFIGLSVLIIVIMIILIIVYINIPLKSSKPPNKIPNDKKNENDDGYNDYGVSLNGNKECIGDLIYSTKHERCLARPTNDIVCQTNHKIINFDCVLLSDTTKSEELVKCIFEEDFSYKKSGERKKCFRECPSDLYEPKVDVAGVICVKKNKK